MNKTLKYIVLLTFACFVGKGYAQEVEKRGILASQPGLPRIGESKSLTSGRQR